MTDFVVGLALGLLIGTNVALCLAAWLSETGKND